MTDGVKVVQSCVFKLLFDLLDTETVCERRVHVHGFKSRNASFCLGLCVKSPHIVKSVAELNENDSDILRHCKKHFSDILDMSFFLIDNVDILDFCQSVHQHGNIRTEKAAQLVKAGLFTAVLNGIVQKCGTDRIRIETERKHDLRYGDRVDDVWVAAVSELSLVKGCGVFIGFVNFGNIVISAAFRQLFKKVVDIRLGFCFGGLSDVFHCNDRVFL